MIRMLATDLDGTLLRPDGTVSARTAAVLAQARAVGFPVLFVTGRPPRWLEPVVEATGHAGVTVCANGALTVDLDHGTVLTSHALPGATTSACARDLRTAVPGAAFSVELVPTPTDVPSVGAARLTTRAYAHEPHYLPDSDARYGPLVGELDDLLAHGEVVKLLARGPAGTDPEEFLTLARDVLRGRVEVTRSMDIPLLEMSARGVSKASALAAYAAGLGIEQHEVAAVGDMPNDVPMLAWAGEGYAVEGSHPESLAAAAHRVPPAEQDGVAQLLELVLTGDRTVR